MLLFGHSDSKNLRQMKKKKKFFFTILTLFRSYRLKCGRSKILLFGCYFGSTNSWRGWGGRQKFSIFGCLWSSFKTIMRKSSSSKVRSRNCWLASISVHFFIWCIISSSINSHHALDTILSEISLFVYVEPSVLCRIFCQRNLPGSYTLVSTTSHSAKFSAVYFCPTSGETYTLHPHPLSWSLLRTCAVGIFCDNTIV